MSKSSVPLHDPRRCKTSADQAYLQRVGDRVRGARDKLGLTRKALSQASGVSERYLADLEAGSGNASLMVLRRISDALSLDIQDLLKEGDEPGADFKAAIDILRTLPPSALSRAKQWLESGVPTATHHAERIALIGLRGAGKSTVGHLLAERLGLPFIELDREIERAAGMELAEIFALQGTTTYRQLELQCLEAIVGSHERAVIATSGGLVTEPAAYELLLATCQVIWLKAEPESHMDRVLAQGDQRPMHGNPQAMDDLRAILQARSKLYARAHATIDTTNLGPAEAADQVLRLSSAKALAS